MDYVTSIISIIPSIWTCGKPHFDYVHNFGQNLDALKTSIAELRNERDDVKGRVDVAEAQLLKSTNVVDAWLQCVHSIEVEADDILHEGAQQLRKRCLNVCCKEISLTSYKLGKRVAKMSERVEDLRCKGKFQSVAEPSVAAPVQMIPNTSTVGLDSILSTAWSVLGEESIRIVGLYGMGGVGKTTLLMKLNNEFQNQICGFDIVITVVISQDVNMRHIQNEIGERLGFSWPESKSMSSRKNEIFNVLKSKRFVLLLDDLWERIELTSIGIPLPDSGNRCKIVFTTRSCNVCGLMEADKTIEVKCLMWDQAWELFCDKVGETSDLFRNTAIQKLAQKVAKKCGGLPLALIVIGRAMASRKTEQEWKHASMSLKKRPGDFSGMGDGVFPLLKFSFDSLPSDSIRACLLFCALYPEDEELAIDLLIRRWVGMGYINPSYKWEEALATGHFIIGILKAACLLEQGVNKLSDNVVKMHDVIRDLAQWLACECGKTNDKILVQTKAGDECKVDWLQVECASLMKSKTTKLDFIHICHNLSTLLLHENTSLRHIHDDFFLYMPALRFLDLSHNFELDRVPRSIGKLVLLEYLDLSRTKIKELPCEMQNLIKLKYLFLNHLSSLHKVPVGVVENLSSLQMIEISMNSFGDTDIERSVGIRELGVLTQIKYLRVLISIHSDLELFLGHDRLARHTRCLVIRNEEGKKETNFTELALSISPTQSCLSLGHMKRLKELRIFHCNEMKELVINNNESELFKSLESMDLQCLPKLVVTWEMRNPLRPCFTALGRISIEECDSMVNIAWLLLVPNLHTLMVKYCQNISEIIPGNSGACDASMFSKLRILELSCLPSLRSICEKSLPFPDLEEVHVYYCPMLTTLPLDSRSSMTNPVLQIKGHERWWKSLQWMDEAEKFCNFSPF